MQAESAYRTGLSVFQCVMYSNDSVAMVNSANNLELGQGMHHCKKLHGWCLADSAEPPT